MEIQWGEPIEVAGVRPTWLRDGEQIACLNRADDWVGPRTVFPSNDHVWSWMKAFKLLSHHPYYTATAKGFTYWPGGDSAPDDWDGGDVLLGNGAVVSCVLHPKYQWKDAHEKYSHIIGYHKREDQPQPTVMPWALGRAGEVAAESMGLSPDNLRLATAEDYLRALARYIEQHEQPPVDPDVLAVRSILAAWHKDRSTEGRSYRTVAEELKIGEYDPSFGFLAALAAYRSAKQ